MDHRTVTIGSIRIGNGHPLAFIAGPCVIESESDTLSAAEKLRKAADTLGIPIIFKSSYDKANRTSVKSFRGPGITEGLRILGKVKQETGMPVLSDVHSPEEAIMAAEYLDILQVPALLSRQTDLIIAAAKTKRPVNIKKGQFMAPEDMENVIEKVRSSGNEEILVTERGVSFGYHNLIVDMRSFPILRGFGCPVVFDATHSVQLPSGQGSASGGQREFIGPLARAAVAAGCDAVFMEVHEDPDRAACDGPNMLPLRDFGKIAESLSELHNLVKGWQ